MVMIIKGSEKKPEGVVSVTRKTLLWQQMQVWPAARPKRPIPPSRPSPLGAGAAAR
jgi:hypothetical protein